MIWLIAIVYIIWRIVQFSLHRGQNSGNLGKLALYFVLELVFTVAGIVGVSFILSGPGAPYAGHFVIAGVICLIISGRLGLHVHKIAQGTENQVPVPATPGQSQLKRAEILTIGMFIVFIMSWPFYQGMAYSIAAVMYALSLVLGILSFRNAKKSTKDPLSKKAVALSVILFNSFFIFLSVIMLIAILGKMK